MGIICSKPKNSRAQARHRLHSMALDAHAAQQHQQQIRHQLRQGSAMSIGHLTTKINTLVMVGPGEGNFMAAPSNSSIPSTTPLFHSSLLANSSNKEVASFGRIKITLELSMRQHALIEKYWREHIALRQRDIFHRTMLNVIEASPKVNEVIACQRYCFRDLTKWPKLNRICQAQFSFYEKLIFTLNLNEQKLLAECIRLGQTHAQYAQYGLKPHFLDIFQHQFLGLLAKVETKNEAEKREMIGAFGVLTTFILDVLNRAYGIKMSEIRLNGRPTVLGGGND